MSELVSTRIRNTAGKLGLPHLAETITVLAVSPLIDVTRATTGQDITLQLTEALPTGRSYQSYLQLVPGVMPDSPTSPGNPAARGGVMSRASSPSPMGRRPRWPANASWSSMMS